MKWSLVAMACLWVFHLQAQEENVVPGEWIVQLEPGIPGDAWVKSIWQENPQWGVHTKRTLSQRLNIWVMGYATSQGSLEAGLEWVRSMPGVVLAQANHTGVELRNTTPNDPDYPVQWALSPTVTGAISAPQAWDISTGGTTIQGDTIVVAVIDGGADLSHVDLDFFVNRNEIPGNGIDDDQNGYIDDYEGWNAYNSTGNVGNDNHGTHVSGIIGARGNNGTGIAGVNWNVKIMPISGSSGQEAIVVEAYAYALEMRARYNETNGAEGAYVVATNSSFGVDLGQPANYPIWCAMYDSLGAYGVLSAGATINSNVNVDLQGDMPTACPSDFLITVTNTTVSGSKNGSAGHGVQTIDLGAPGTNVYSTEIFQSYGSQTGTSMATPHVAGAIALMYSTLCSNQLEFYGTDYDDLARYVGQTLVTRGVDSLPFLATLTKSQGKLNLLKCLEAIQDYDCVRAEIVEVIQDSCNTCEGLGVVHVSEGKAPFQYTWSQNFSDSSRNMGLCAGSHTVTITDAFGYSEAIAFQVQAPPVFAVATQATFPSGTGTLDGSIVLTPSGGVAPYEVLWTTGDTTLALNNLDSGIYEAMVTDAYGCTVPVLEALFLVSTSEGTAQTPWRLYPNPASGDAFLEWPIDQAPAKVYLYDVAGRSMWERNLAPGSLERIPTEVWPVGIYLGRLELENGQVETFKLVRNDY